MRAALGPILLASTIVACNSIVGWGDLQEVNAPTEGADSSTSGEGGTSSSSSSGGVLPGADAGPRCDPTKDFQAPVKISSLDQTGSIEAFATLTSDELTMFFQKGQLQGAAAISKSTRTARDQDNWSAPTPETELNSGTVGGAPTITPDGTTMFWAQAVDGARTQIFVSTRTTAALPFAAGQAFGPTSSSATDAQPFITADGRELWFASNRATLDVPQHLFRSVRSTGGNYGAPAIVDELVGPTKGDGTTAEERTAALTVDGLTIYYSTNRDGGPGHYDIWTAHRPSLSDPFTGFALVPNASTDGTDDVTWVSPDDCVLYITHLDNGGGDPDLFTSTRGK